MGTSSLQLKRCLCCSLRVGTLVTLWYSLFTSVVGSFLFLIKDAVIYGLNISDILSPTLLLLYLPEMVLAFVPLVVGLCGTYQRKPMFLMVTIESVFILTGFLLHDLFRTILGYNSIDVSIIITLAKLVLMWYFALVWYSYFMELKKELKKREAGNVPFHSV